MSHKPTIAIDGPAGSGKSTTARALARTLGYVFVDSGAMYRAVTLKALESGVDVTDKEKVTSITERIDIVLHPSPDKTVIFIDGKDCSDAIRDPEVSKNVSAVAALPEVRALLVAKQQEMGKQGGVIMDGRDVGTVVFPFAELKVFMKADPEERARRRLKELLEQGKTTTLEEVLADMQARDKADAERSTGPLKQADDAILVDTTNLTEEQTIAELVRLTREAEQRVAK